MGKAWWQESAKNMISFTEMQNVQISGRNIICGHFLTSVVNQSSDNYWTRFLVNIFSSRLELKTSPPAFIFAKCGHWSNHSFLFQVLVISWIYALCRKKLHFNRIEFQTNNNVNWLGDKIWQTENSKEKQPKRTFRFALPKNSKLCLLWDCGCSSACSSFFISALIFCAYISLLLFIASTQFFPLSISYQSFSLA